MFVWNTYWESSLRAAVLLARTDLSRSRKSKRPGECTSCGTEASTYRLLLTTATPSFSGSRVAEPSWVSRQLFRDAPYGVRTRVVRVAKVSFISQEDLLRHLHATGTVAYAAAELLSAIYRFELAGTSALFQSQSAEQKTARFLLGLSLVRELRCNATAGELENFNCAPVTSITAKTTFRWY